MATTVTSVGFEAPIVPLSLKKGKEGPLCTALPLSSASTTAPVSPISTPRHHDAAPPDGAALSQALLPNYSRNLIIALVVLSNLSHFISNAITIGAGFKLSSLLGHETGPGKANWMPAAYSLAQGAVVLVSGRLGAIYGHHLMVRLGIAMLVVFSIANGFCTSYESFVAIRALTGVGGGLCMPNAIAVITTMVPPGQSRNVALGFIGAAGPIGGWIGILLAGVFTEYVAWKWTFFFLAIFGAILLAGLCFLTPKEVPMDKDGKIDYPGAVLGISGLLLFSYAWNDAPSAGWDSPSTISTMVVSVVLFSTFLVWEWRFTPHPIMPLSVFRAPTFSALIAVVLLNFMSFSISLWYMTAWQQLVRGWSMVNFAVSWIPFAIGATFSVGLAAWLIPRLPAQWIMALGLAAVLAANLLLATQPVQQTYWAQTFPSIVLSSICPDFVYVAAQIIASNSVSRRQQGVAGSLIGTLNLYGGSLGLGIAGTIETQLTKGRAAGDETAAVHGYRAALYFAAALAAAALVLDFIWVRVPKDEREGWQNEEDLAVLGPVVDEMTDVERSMV